MANKTVPIRDDGVPNYPSNSFAASEKEKAYAKKDVEATKKVEKIVSTPVVVKKKGAGKKFAESFIVEDMSSVGRSIVTDVLIPALQNLVTDAINNGLSMMFGGSVKPSNIQRTGLGSVYNYNGVSSPTRANRSTVPAANRSRHGLDEVLIGTRVEAERVLSYMADLLIDYGQVTVADFYDAVGLGTQFTDHNWGWIDLSTAKVVHRYRAGWTIDLPAPIQVD